jgi:hypothetical protein
MKTRPLDRMRDPFFAQLMFFIEDLVCTVDSEARGKEIVLKDSQILSALTKAHGLVSGKEPKINDSTESDRILKNLIFAIAQSTANPAGPVLEQLEDGILKLVNKEDWGLAIEAVMESLSIRRSKIPGSREYLDFLKDFIGQAKARANSRLQKGSEVQGVTLSRRRL